LTRLKQPGKKTRSRQLPDKFGPGRENARLNVGLRGAALPGEKQAD